MKQLLATLSIVALMGAGCALPGTESQTNEQPTVPPPAAEGQTPEATAPTPEQEAAKKPAVKKPAAPAPAHPEVTMGESAFAPQTIAINVGDTIVWKNASTKSHTVTSNNGFLLLNSGNIAPGKTFSHTFTSSGSYTYNCGIHENMTGTIIVR